MSKKWILAAAAVLAVTTAVPAAAKEQTRMLNPPAGQSAPALQQMGYTSERMVAPLVAPRPAGDLKKVTKDGYSFQMPVVWQLSEGSAKAAFDEVLSARRQEVSGVAFFTLDGKEPDLPGDMMAEALRAPIGVFYKVTGKIENRAGAAKIVLYYSAEAPAWGIAAVSVGEDSAPTAEETAAYMVYTMAREG